MWPRPDGLGGRPPHETWDGASAAPARVARSMPATARHGADRSSRAALRSGARACPLCRSVLAIRRCHQGQAPPGRSCRRPHHLAPAGAGHSGSVALACRRPAVRQGRVARLRGSLLTVLPSAASLKSLRAAARKSVAPNPYAGFGNPLLSGPSGTDRSAWSRQACAPAQLPAGGQQVAALPAGALQRPGFLPRGTGRRGDDPQAATPARDR